MDSLNDLLTLNSLDLPNLLTSEEVQEGSLILLRAQSDWNAKVGILAPEKAASSDEESGG
jgi:hypothetical protein